MTAVLCSRPVKALVFAGLAVLAGAMRCPTLVAAAVGVGVLEVCVPCRPAPSRGTRVSGGKAEALRGEE